MKILLSFLLVTSFSGYCANYSPEALEKRWAICEYQASPNTEQIKCYTHLIKRIKQLRAQNKKDLTLQLLLAINLASLAGVDDAPDPLKLIRQAKDLIEHVISINPSTLDSASYVMLGALYYRAPGWPISFGDNKKAAKYLKKAISIHPNNLTTLYFFADFLAQQGHKKQAITYLKRALTLKISPAHIIAETGRKKDIKKLLKKLES
ncbi:tetratricopeptide repeat protein [Celerinatantimonas diazotrophica]|nr:tetratricopeptide repeat protein [Celerinatantimonas diazotrophica]